MRAAILREYGGIPELGELEDPVVGDGEETLDVLAAGLNPIDLRIASGTLAARRPELPSGVGSEGVGRSGDGRRLYFDSCVAPYGSVGERTKVRAGTSVEVPDGIEDAHALCYGIAGLAAWLSLERKARVGAGDKVLILGASGVVGLIGVQAARLLGASLVVAAARSEDGLRRARERGADAAVRLEGSVEELVEALRDASGGGFDVVLDPLWGEPAAAALQALNFRGRIVQLGQSAGASATFASADIRFKEIAILGHTNFAAPFELRAQTLQRMWRHAAAGELQADYETLPLEAAPEAWRRQAQSPNVKLALTP